MYEQRGENTSTPETTDDYRKMSKILGGQQQECTIFQVVEERVLVIVIRGILEFINQDEIRQELLDKGFEIIDFALTHCNIIERLTHTCP